jgi:prolyl 4-hydroxylase
MIKFIKKYKFFIILSVCLSIILWKIYNRYPPIQYFENVFTPNECKQIIEYAIPKLERSQLDEGEMGTYGIERTSSQCWIKPDELPCLKRASELVAKVTGLSTKNQEEWQVLRYKPGQEYKPHFDAANPFSDDYLGTIERDRKRGWGRRVYTFFIYLNNVEEGGETYFPKLDVKISPKPGKAALWSNLNRSETGYHPMSEHAGTPVIKGEKWAINVWIRQKPTTY